MASLYDDPDCVAAWLFDGESGGDDAQDSSVLGVNTLTDLGGVACLRSASGKFGDCLETDGASDMALGITDAAQSGLDLQLDNWSLVLWIKSDGAWPAADPIFIGKATASAGYWLKYNQTSGLIDFVYTWGGGSQVVSSLAAPAASTWIHLAVVELNDVIYLYVDGVLQGTTDGSRAVELTAADFVLATDHDRGAYFNGFIDDAAVFKRALTANDLAALIRDGLSGSAGVLHDVIVDVRSAMAPQISATRMVSASSVTEYLEPEIEIADAPAADVDISNALGGDLDVNGP